jgi:predicted RNA-binding protein associated with RNAse of E/G family
LRPGIDESWPKLPPGTELILAKVDPDGAEVTRYPGVVIDVAAPAPWVAVRATWANREYNLDGLKFVTGDRLHEFFSPKHCFNVFSVFSPEGELRGWYANVTHPSRLDTANRPMTLSWHDLYIDVIALPDGRISVRDENELAASSLAEREPALHRQITRTRDELLSRAKTRAFPFHETEIDVAISRPH